MDTKSANPPASDLPQEAAPLAKPAPEDTLREETAREDTAKQGWETITLSEPIVRGETTIDKVQLRKPKSGELRGLNLQDLLQTDIAAILKLLPRITVPPLTDHELDDLAPSDLVEMGGAIRGFFMTRGEHAMMEAMIAEQQPRS